MYVKKDIACPFDAIALVDLHVQQTPVDPQPHIKARLCYVNSATGVTYGFLDLENNSVKGMEVLSKETVSAWHAFCQSLEKDQGTLLFGKGQSATVGSHSQAESETPLEGPEGWELNTNVGLGGGT